MDTSQATTTLMTRIQELDGQNASKIMGYILIQDHGQEEMIRLAFSPDVQLLSYIDQAKMALGLSSFPPRTITPNNGFHYPTIPPFMPPSDSLNLPPPRRTRSFDAAPFRDDGCPSLSRPCMYFAKGFCRNGSGCKFLHVDHARGFDAIDVGSSTMTRELFNLKRRGEFSPMELRGVSSSNSSSRQIYLTFPANSRFNEDDITDYFSTFGPVQDVRIPHQQDRMFGFVTFFFPESVQLILTKKNPHFVCDSRVLVKPYKEKAKFREKKQHFERVEASACLGPSEIDPIEHYAYPYGPRMLLSPQDMLLRKQMEQEAQMQHAIEIQAQRMMRLQLRYENLNNHQYLQAFPFSSPRSTHSFMNQHVPTSYHSINIEDYEEPDGGQETAVTDDGKLLQEGVNTSYDHHESLEHNLPDSLFASPTISFGADDGTSVEMPRYSAG